MFRKILGYLICSLGSIFFFLSIFFDYLNEGTMNFGPKQIILVIVSIILICLGFLLIRNIRFSKTFHAINNVLPPVNPLITTIVIFLLIALMTIYPIKFVINYLSSPYPFEYRDAAGISAANAFSNGVNPYRLENFPMNIYLYGILSPLLLSVFINLVDHPMVAAKGFDFFFLIMLLVLSFYIFRKRKASIESSLIGILLLLNSFCLIWKINGSRPDASGLFFVVFGYSTLFFKDRPNNIHIILCALFSVISFYFKQYMVFSIPIVFLYLFFFVSKQKGLIFISAGAMMGFISFLLLRHLFPLYYEYSIIHHMKFWDSSISHMLKQTIFFLKYFWVLCIFYLFYLYDKFSTFNSKVLKRIRIRLIEFEAAFVQGCSMDLLDIGIIISIILLTFSLGKHIGNQYTYYGELLLPFLLYLTIPKIDELIKTNLIRFLIQFSLIAFCIYPFQSTYKIDFLSHNTAFNTIYKYADRCNYIYDKTPLIAVYKIEHNMIPIFNNGQNEYARSVIPVKGTIFEKFSKQTSESINLKLFKWENNIEESIDNQKFDCIFAEDGQNIENYIQLAKVEHVLGRTVYIFKPGQQ